jgi:tetratricopeptide (TPR) repeat protein
MVCPHCGTDTPAPAIACKTCRTPFGGYPAIASPDSATIAASIGTNGVVQPPLGFVPVGTAGPLAAGAPFGSRYRILRELGSGGMGVVYQAWDAELAVAVALKVIRPEVSADPFAAREVERRFKRELLLARQVTHKHVVRIHDLGEVDGIKYLTMPFIQGRDLAHLLHERGNLPVPEVVRLARQIATGLQAAHDAGVVHRDLKPENVMIDEDGQALIMDFGISRSVSAGPATMTMAGAVMGTLEYMAPEQARGGTVDHRADIYAFGLMLYDMLAGRHRVSSSERALLEMMGRMHESPPPLRSVRPDVPEGLEQVITKCLEPDAEKRYLTTAALVADLDALDADGQAHKAPSVAAAPSRATWITTAIALIAIVAAAAFWWTGRSRPAGPPPVRPTVSVLIADFQNPTGETVFQGSLEQALAIALEGAPFVFAYPRADAQRTIATLQPNGRLDEAGARLVAAREGLNVVLAGGISRNGDGYTLAIKALDPRGDRTLFSREATARDKGDVLRAVGSVASNIREDLGDTPDSQHRASDAETFTAGSIEAMRAYARGKELDRAGKPKEALAALEEAVALDPNFGMAYAHIGTIYRNLKIDDKAKANYDQAFKHLDRMTEREKYRTYGVYYFGVVRNYPEAIKTYEKLVELYPADNTGYANLALAHLYDRNIPKAMAMGRKAIEIYPRNVLQRTNYATYAMYAGDFKTALAETGRVLADNPSYVWANLTFALSTLASGDEAGARAAYAKLAAVDPLGASLANLGEADLEMYYGRDRRALEVLATGIAQDEKDKNSETLGLKLVAAAEASLALGRASNAAGFAERAVRASQHEAVLVSAAHVLLETGATNRAREIARPLEDQIPPQVRSYARVIKADVALHEGHLPAAIDELHAAEQLHDSWVVHLVLGQAYLAARQFPAAAAEFEKCVKRRGEATDVFFADTSSLRYLPPVYYWLGRAQEAVGAGDAAKASYREFLKVRSSEDEADPLAADAAQRVGR